MSTRIHTVLCVFVIMTMVDFNEASRIKRLEQRFVRLETRIDTESKFRRDDMSNLFDKLDSMSSVLNMSAEDARCQGQQGTNGEKSLRSRSSQEISKLCTDWRRDLMQLTVAFKDEKKLNAKLRKNYIQLVDKNDFRAGTNHLKIQLKEHLQHEIADLQTSQMDLKEQLQHEITELKNQLLHISEQINNFSEMTALKNQLNECTEAYNARIEATTVKIETTTVTNERFESCVDLYENGHRVSGQYDVYPDGRSEPIRVYCDQSIETGGGWTVFQRRKDGSENFYRGWMDYKHGFGDLNKEFWLGNEHLATLTSTCCSELRIDLQNTDGVKKYALYKTFQIKPASERYRLNVDGFSGNAGDSIEWHNGQQFTTKDLDNDPQGVVHCAIHYTGAWWYYNECALSSLNGQYEINNYTGIYWSGFTGTALIFTEMKFRRLF